MAEHQLIAVLIVLSAETCTAAGDVLLPDLSACQAPHSAPVPIGETLARAEDLRKAAKRFEAYDYDFCYRVGRSCYNEVDVPIQLGVEDDSYLACRDLEVTERSDDYKGWLRAKKAFIGCLVADFDRRASLLEKSVLKAPPKSPSVAETLAALSGTNGMLHEHTVQSLASFATWCSREPRRVRALCADGTGAIADGQGQKLLAWKMSGDSICVEPYGDAESCFTVTVSHGQFSLLDSSGLMVDSFSVIPNVTKDWPTSCQ